MVTNIRDTILEQWKDLAEILLKEDKSVYIKDFNNEYYFGDLIFVGDNSFEIQCFAPEKKKDKKFVIYWASVIKFDAYKKEM